MENNIVVKTKEEIIKETYEYYKADPIGRRSVSSTDAYGNCLYIGENGQRCAFSRCCKEDKNDILSIREGSAASYLVENYPEVLKPEYYILDGGFWDDLQQEFHDKRYNWDLVNNTISEKGEETYQYLLNKYKGQ